MKTLDMKTLDMKTLGLIGGMSWESTVPYYRIINECVRAQLGGLHSAKILLFSVDFHEIEQLQRVDDWQTAGHMLAHAANTLERAGADLLVLCTNTMHKIAPAIEQAVAIPLLHIADPTAMAVKKLGITTIGLLGTRFTMEQAFYIERLQQRHGITALVPNLADRDSVHRVIYEELCQGKILESSRAEYRRIVKALIEAGAQAIIMGCTEIALLIKPEDSEVPLFDTAALHARYAAEYAMAP